MSSVGFQTAQEMYKAASALTGKSRNASIDTAMLTILNIAYEEALDGPWPQLNRGDEIGLRNGSESAIFVMESGASSSPLTPEAAEPLSIHLKSIKQDWQFLHPTEFYERVGGSAIGEQGQSSWATIVGTTAQYRELTEAHNLSVKCDVDTNDNVLSPRVRYRTSDAMQGAELLEEVSGTFSTGVALSKEAAAGWPVMSVEVPKGWAGTLTITDDAGTPVEYVKVQPLTSQSSAGSNFTRVYAGLRMRLWPVPGADDAGVFVYRWKPPRLTQATDIPVIPVASFLTHKLAAALYQRDGDHKSAMMQEGLARDSLENSYRNMPSQPRQLRPRFGNMVDSTGLGRFSGTGW